MLRTAALGREKHAWTTALSEDMPLPPGGVRGMAPMALLYFPYFTVHP